LRYVSTIPTNATASGNKATKLILHCTYWSFSLERQKDTEKEKKRKEIKKTKKDRKIIMIHKTKIHI